ncbi:MAG: glutathione transferase GstA [Betaproteobacteria bacterium RIFCSPLOWO2_02_FULL_63_19]|nr:MAG: glutathione transferase GstA [Betaproteobacteria bacterium RIFCSPLOWO2_02_FULL_63_19]
MKLYYSPGSCSLGPDIVLREAGVAFDLVRVNLQGKKLLDGADYHAVNPKGQVPVLALDDGGTLTESAAIVQYLADQYPQADLAPAAGSAARYRLQEWLSFIGSELHKTFPALFIPRYPAEFKPFARQTLERKFAVLEQHLAGNPYLMGEKFTVADAYCFAIMIWHKRSDIDLSPWPNLKSYMERIASRPKVREAMDAEAS